MSGHAPACAPHARVEEIRQTWNPTNPRWAAYGMEKAIRDIEYLLDLVAARDAALAQLREGLVEIKRLTDDPYDGRSDVTAAELWLVIGVVYEEADGALTPGAHAAPTRSEG